MGLITGSEKLKETTVSIASAVAAPDELDALALEAGPDEVEQPATAEQQPPAPDVPAKALLQPLLTLAFAKAAPAWKVTSAEVAELSEAWGALVDKWAPGGLLNKYGLEITALLVTVQVLAPRFGHPTQEPTPEKTEPERAPDVEQRPTAPVLY